MTIEKTILTNILKNPDFANKVIPYIQGEYFPELEYQKYFQIIHKNLAQYNKILSPSELEVEIDSLEDITEREYKNLKQINSEISKEISTKNTDWLLDKTENWCKDRALENALSLSITVAQDENKNLSKTSIPDILSKALAISFDTKLGHNWAEDVEERYKTLRANTNFIPYHLEMFNKITGGGMVRKEITCVAAGTGVGKSALMCDIAGNLYKKGYNVLYISMEMADIKLSERIDASLLNISLDDLRKLPEDTIIQRISGFAKNRKNQLITKEYPNGSASDINFKALVKELKQKTGFYPDVIFIDYMNICASSRQSRKNSNSYGYIKSIVEELRAMAQELNVHIFTGTQVNRSGYTDSDIGIEHTADSMGGPMSLDTYLALISTEELEQMGQILVKQLKNRNGDLNKFNKFVIGLDRSKMKFYDIQNNSNAVIQPINPPTQKPQENKKTTGKVKF